MSRYIQLADLRDWMGFVGSQGTVQNGLMQDSIDRAESAIDNYTRRNFVGTVGTYYVNHYSQDKVVNQALYLTKDLFSLTSVTNGDSQNIPVGSVWLEPRNERPARILRLMSSYVWVWNTDSDVMIVGTWGFGTIPPDDIKQAAVRLAAYNFRLKDTGVTDISGFTEAGEVTLPKGLPDDVRMILERYRSRSGGVV